MFRDLAFCVFVYVLLFALSSVVSTSAIEEDPFPKCQPLRPRMGWHTKTPNMSSANLRRRADCSDATASAGYDDKRLSQDTSVTRSDFERKENNEQLPSLTKNEFYDAIWAYFVLN